MREDRYPIRGAWLALAFGLLPFVAAHVAYALSIRDGHAPACMPYWDGCTSISRAARHGVGNELFKLIMIPCAGVLGALWWQAQRWLVARGDTARSLMLTFGEIGAVALAVYVSYLGDEGEFSRWLRRYGALIYFSCTYLAQLGYVRRVHRLGAPDALANSLRGVCVLTLSVGLCSVAASALAGPELKDRLENALEWNLGALFTLWFLLQAWFWRSSVARVRP